MYGTWRIHCGPYTASTKTIADRAKAANAAAMRIIGEVYWAKNGLSIRAKCVQVDANSDPHPIHRCFAPVNRPPPFRGRKAKIATHFPPPERGRTRAQICASRWGPNPQLAILLECTPL